MTNECARKERRIARPARAPSAVPCLCVAAIVSALLAPVLRAEEPPAPTAQNIKMNFKDTPLETVLEQLSEMTGLVVLKDAPLEGRITIISKQDMNVDDAVALLNSVLKEKGYVGLRTGRVLKLVKLEDAKKRNIPVRTGNDPAQIEPSDEVFTQVIPIKYIDAIQLKKDFTPMIPSYADLSANASSNSLILTDTGANIRRIAEIIRAMDTQSTVVAEVKVFQLKYANASSAARLINDTFKEEGQAQAQQQNLPFWMRGAAAFTGRGGGGGGGPFGGGPFGGPGGGPGGGAAGAAQQEQGQRIRKVTASADDRTNAVVVSANPETMKIIAQVIKDLDSNPSEDQAVFVYKCKNAQATNLEAVLNAIFGVQGGSLSRSATTQRTSTGVGTNVQRGASSSRLPGSSVSGGGTFAQPSSATQGQFSRGGSAGNLPAGLQSGDLTGQVYVVADTDSNSLIVLTGSRNFEKVKAILADLDKPVPQVLIKVLIAEVTHDKNDDLGVDISVLTKGTMKSLVTDLGVAGATGGLITKVVEKDLTATLRALEGVGKLDILSRPYIMASDNQLSSITVGQEVPFIISSRTTDTGQTINTIEYQDIGIILNVTAHINAEGLVIMDVAPEVSSLTGTTVPISENVSAPVFAKRSAQSRVGVRDGQTVVIGGLMEDRKTENVKGVPGLSRIPGLGALFRRKTTDTSKTELLIFLTPHVAQEPGVLKSIAEREEAALKLVPKAVTPGAFQDHMDGMARGGEFVPPEEPVPPKDDPPARAPVVEPKPE
ncbi:MAG: type II secretion system secretin GspD [Planctomycetota bacterium]|nr:type II secretion system secretin GspD [Planctomycetota bacterium]